MGSCCRLAVALASLVLLGVLARAGEDADLARKLRAAAGPLLSPSPADAIARGALVEVLDIATQVAARAELPGGVAPRLREADAGWRKSPEAMPAPAVVAELAEAYAALHGGRRFAFPPDVRTIDQAREACRRAIEGAASALADGRGMLQFLLLVTTPMEAH